MLKRFATGLILAVMACAPSGCAPAPSSGKGFTLPDGNVDEGQVAFVSLKCHACHTVSGVEVAEIDAEMDTRVELGGKVTRVSTYGELVTSIINPSHKLASGYMEDVVATDSESKMTVYNDVLTVQQLIDLVAFLQSRYELKPYEPTTYPPYY